MIWEWRRESVSAAPYPFCWSVRPEPWGGSAFPPCPLFMQAELQSGGVVILISMKAGAGLVEIGSRHTEQWRRAAVASCSAHTHKDLSLCKECYRRRRAEMLISDMTSQRICVLLYKNKKIYFWIICAALVALLFSQNQSIPVPMNLYGVAVKDCSRISEALHGR